MKQGSLRRGLAKHHARAGCRLQTGEYAAHGTKRAPPFAWAQHQLTNARVLQASSPSSAEAFPPAATGCLTLESGVTMERFL
jgi:hypothetical protein